MKKFIHKSNTYLLENYPTLWNTKVAWMLGIAAIIHIIFYFFGLGSLTNPESLHERNAIDNFFENGMVFFSFIVSILLLVAWLIFMFKNNAFKNFYPTNKIDIFKQFALYFIIILSSISFYYSYLAGAKTYIKSTYKDTEMAQDISLANKTAPFFSHGINNYTIANVNYPKPLNTFYCEVRTENIDYQKVYYRFLDSDYQFYNLRSKTRNKKDSYARDEYDNSVYTESTDSTITYFYKDKVQDISSYIKTTEPSYYNYSKLFYSTKTNSYDSHDYHYDIQYEIDATSKKKFNEKEALIVLNKNHYELLERENSDEIKAILFNFLELSKKYKIKHNLNADTWQSLVYHPKDFKLKHIIRGKEPRLKYNKLEYDFNYDNLEYKENLTAFEKLYIELKSDYYLESDKLGIAFENIEELKTKPLIAAEIHFFLWISFTIALFVLIFRLTGLKPLIFSVIATGVIMIFVALVAALFNFASIHGNNFEYFMFYFIFLICTIILSIAIFMSTKIKKQIAAIFINISLAGFVPYIFLICGIITTHQENICRIKYIDYNKRKENCFVLLEALSPGIWSFIFLIVGFIFVYFFSKIILNWKAMPEG